MFPKNKRWRGIDTENSLHQAFIRLMTEKGRHLTSCFGNLPCHVIMLTKRVTGGDLIWPSTTKNFTFCASLKWTEKAGGYSRAMFLFLVSGIFTSIRANPTNAMRLYDIATQHIVSIKARLGIWLCDCSQRRLKDIKVMLQSVIYRDYFVLVEQKCEKLQWGPTRYVSSPTAVNIFKCVLLDRKVKADTTGSQLLFPTNSDGRSNNCFCDHRSISFLEE